VALQLPERHSRELAAHVKVPTGGTGGGGDGGSGLGGSGVGGLGGSGGATGGGLGGTGGGNEQSTPAHPTLQLQYQVTV
jgi:hypothetical protein